MFLWRCHPVTAWSFALAAALFATDASASPSDEARKLASRPTTPWLRETARQVAADVEKFAQAPNEAHGKIVLGAIREFRLAVAHFQSQFPASWPGVEDEVHQLVTEAGKLLSANDTSQAEQVRKALTLSVKAERER